jgi:acyl-coenzyme A thioesterase PaaI-like protein
MLDGCIGIAGAVCSGGVLAMPLAEMNVSFVRPVPPGPIVGKEFVTRLGRKVGFIEGTLFGLDGQVLARASGTAIPTPFPDTYTTP